MKRAKAMMANWCRRLGLVIGVVAAVAAVLAEPASAADRPNFLWITLEDISPHVGCYGDEYARTPNIDALAARGVRYTNAFSTIGVCAPSRSTLITGVYAPSLGTHPMRCQGDLPDEVRCFPQYLREAGYYCTNNVKTDYNFKAPRESWDESSRNAHYRNRGKDQPFFAVFNLNTCHESQIRLPENEYRRRMATLDPADKHDPAKATLPPYHPDTPEVRKDWARYADAITFTDRRIGELLKELEDSGLADDTIVFCFSDHGAGMPRSKRWLYDSSLRVPFVVYVPEKFKSLAPGAPGSTVDRLVSLVDVAPTMLSLAGLEPKEYMQGVAFLGPKAGKPREYIYGHRDRMDERTDVIRGVRDGRYKYIRNYYPQRPYFHEQFLGYGYEMPTLRVWQALAAAGKLQGPQAIFMARQKPEEELYDTEADPHEINNLVNSPEHRETLDRMRKELNRWQREIVDLGYLAEADLRSRFDGKPAYSAVRKNRDVYPIDRIASAVESTFGVTDAREREEKLRALLSDADPAVRFWGAARLGALDASKVAAETKEALTKSLDDAAGWVRIAAADSLCRLGDVERGVPVLVRSLEDKDPWIRHQAIESVDRLDEKAGVTAEMLGRLREDANDYVVRVAKHMTDEVNGVFAEQPAGK